MKSLQLVTLLTIELHGTEVAASRVRRHTNVLAVVRLVSDLTQQTDANSHVCACVVHMSAISKDCVTLVLLVRGVELTIVLLLGD